jgi:hypothetical protein
VTPSVHSLPPDAPLQPLLEWAQLKADRADADAAGVDLHVAAAAAKPSAEGAASIKKMQIFVKPPSGTTVVIRADHLMTVLEFKQAIEKKTGEPACAFAMVARLCHYNAAAAVAAALWQLGTGPECFCLRQAQRKQQATSLLPLSLCEHACVAMCAGMPPKDQRLCHAGPLYDDNLLLCMTRLSNESTVFLNYRARGGMFHASSGRADNTELSAPPPAVQHAKVRSSRVCRRVHFWWWVKCACLLLRIVRGHGCTLYLAVNALGQELTSLGCVLLHAGEGGDPVRCHTAAVSAHLSAGKQ